MGAVLDKEKIKNVSIPVLLIHGTEDEIVPFKEGRILNLDSIRERNRDLLGYGSIASSFSISFTSPIFYGSYVVDSVFNRHGYVHETFFQDGVGHEFYNKEFYKIKVLAMIVNYLYKIIELDEKRPPSLWSRMPSLHKQHPAEAQFSFAFVLFVFPLAESNVFHFEFGAFGFEDLYVLIKPALL